MGGPCHVVCLGSLQLHNILFASVHLLRKCAWWHMAPLVTLMQLQSGTDVRELLIYGSYGAIVSNVGHVWYRYLNVVTNRTFRLGTYPGIGTKLAADVFLFNPIHVMCLLSYTHILKGKPVKVRAANTRCRRLALTARKRSICGRAAYAVSLPKCELQR
jgi:hypothetical protein